MPEYIEREAPIKDFSGGESVKSTAESIADERFVEAIKRAPTADVVEVVRCRDCRRATEDIMLDGFYDCEKDELIHDGNHFCGHGKRKEGAEE